MKSLVTLSFLLITCPILSFAQEQTGHGRQRRGQEQQQQSIPQKRKVIRGKKAESLYKKIEKSNTASDLSQNCSEPVWVVRSERGAMQECFDRGESFNRGSRYKCYVETDQTTSTLGAFLFETLHNECGGDGIHPLKKRRQM